MATISVLRCRYPFGIRKPIAFMRAALSLPRYLSSMRTKGSLLSSPFMAIMRSKAPQSRIVLFLGAPRPYTVANGGAAGATNLGQDIRSGTKVKVGGDPTIWEVIARVAAGGYELHDPSGNNDDMVTQQFLTVV